MHSYSQEYGKTKINKILTLLLQVLIFLSTFSVYLHNLSPSVYGGDSGDFLSAIAVKGVAHPSGYPLFMLLGILFSYLPFDQTLAWKVSLLSAIFTSLTNVLIFIFVYRFSKNRILALISAFSYAFIFPIFLYAEVTEVFALHYFLLLFDFYLAYLFFDKQKIIYFYLFSIFLGLSFANNELILLILPACAFFIIQAFTKAFKNKFLF